jgi:hypothetical protein
MQVIVDCYSSFTHYRAVIQLHLSGASPKPTCFEHSSRMSINTRIYSTSSNHRYRVSRNLPVSQCRNGRSLEDGLMAVVWLLMESYPSSHIGMSSLDDLLASIAMVAFKQNRLSAIAFSLPPTSNAFYHHCARVARQVHIWYQAFKSDMMIEVIEPWFPIVFRCGGG